MVEIVVEIQLKMKRGRSVSKERSLRRRKTERDCSTIARQGGRDSRQNCAKEEADLGNESQSNRSLLGG